MNTLILALMLIINPGDDFQDWLAKERQIYGMNVIEYGVSPVLRVIHEKLERLCVRNLLFKQPTKFQIFRFKINSRLEFLLRRHLYGRGKD